MRLKVFTQSYFLIQCNKNYTNSLIKRAKAVTNSVVVLGIGLYAWYPRRLYTPEIIH